MAGPVLDWIETRQAVAGSELLSFIEQGFSSGAEGEDQFDAMVGLMGMLDVVDGRRADGAPDNPDVRNREGWIFGQAQDVRILPEHTRNGL